MYTLLAQQDGSAAAAAGGGIISIIYLAVAILSLVGIWKTFVKAGQPGWAAIIPIYNIIVLLQVAGKPLWWIVLFFIPIANVVVSILIMVAIAKNFGKGVGYALGLIFLPLIFWPMLGFGDATYQPVAPATA